MLEVFPFPFNSLTGFSAGISNSALGIRNCGKTAIIKKHKSIINKKKKKQYEVVSWENTKLNTVEVFISKILVDSSINHEKIVIINSVWKKYDWEKKSKILII